MQDEYRDFIGIYKNAFSSDFCKHVVTHFDGALGNGAGHTRQEVGDNKHYRSDTCMDSRSGDMFTPYNGTTVNKVFFSGLQECQPQVPDFCMNESTSCLLNFHLSKRD